MTTSASADGLGARLRTIAVAALADVDALGVEGADRDVLLRAMVEARLGRFSPQAPESRSPTRRGEGWNSDSEHESDSRSDDMLTKVAARMGLDRETVELVYDYRDGELGFVASSRRVSDNKSEAARQLALIVAAGRQAAELEEWTQTSAVRRVVSDYGRLDSSNFAANIQLLDKDGACLFRGKGVSRELKVTRPGMEAAAAMVRTLAGQTT
jgi:hypothetical protein